MNNDSSNIELQKQIDDYIKGNLSEDEARELWKELLKQPESIDRLQTKIDLTRYHQQADNPKNTFSQYYKWFAAALP